MELVTAYGFIQVVNAIINLFSLWIIGKPYNQVNVILAIVLSVVISILFGVVIKNSNQIKVKNSVVAFIVLVKTKILPRRFWKRSVDLFVIYTCKLMKC